MREPLVAPKPAMSNQAFMDMPMLTVTGRTGAVGHTNFTCCSLRAGAMLPMPSPLSPNLRTS